MVAHVRHEDDEPTSVVVAQAKGVLSARDHVSVGEAAAALRNRPARSGYR